MRRKHRAGSKTERAGTPTPAVASRRGHDGVTPSGPRVRGRDVLELQRFGGNQATLRFLAAEPDTAQRTIVGYSTMREVADDDRLWLLYTLLDGPARTAFRTKLASYDDHAFAEIRADALPFVQAWFDANAAAIFGPAPGRIDVALQNVANYGYPNMPRFRWFGTAGPHGIQFATVGINLHRGPVYSNLGHAWIKIDDWISWELQTGALPAATRGVLEAHALGHANANVRGLADNDNLP